MAIDQKIYLVNIYTYYAVKGFIKNLGWFDKNLVYFLIISEKSSAQKV